MATDNSAKKQGTARGPLKRHHCPCGRIARAVRVIPGRRIQYECDANHRHPRKSITLR